MAYGFDSTSGITYADAGFGKSAVFDGTSYALSNANGNGLSGTYNRTLEGFFTPNASSFPGGVRVIAGWAHAFQMQLTTDGKVTVVVNDTVVITSTASINDNQRHHLEMSCSASDVYLFVDGALAGHAAVDMTTAPFNPNNGLALGAYGPFNIDDYKFIGQMDDIAVWNSVLHTDSFTPRTSPVSNMASGLVALWHLDGDLVDMAGVVPPPAAPVFGSAVADNLNSGHVNIAFSLAPYDWSQANALHAGPPLSAFSIPGHTFSQIIPNPSNNQVVLLGVSPLFGPNEVLTLTYTAPTDGSGIYDATGTAAVASFGPVSIANNVIATSSAPSSPTITGISAGNASVSVSFSPPASDGGSPISNYTVTLSTGQTASGTASPITVTATNGVAVTATVTATNSTGTSAASAPSNSVTPNSAAQIIVAPAAPTNVQATAGDTNARITFTPGSDGGEANVTYTVIASPGGATFTGMASPIDALGLTNGTSYTFTVHGSNSAGAGPNSAPSNAVTPVATVGAPRSFYYIPPTFRRKSVGAGKDFATLNDAAGWMYQRDLVAEGSGVAFVVFENQPGNPGGFLPETSSGSIYGLIVPALGMSAAEMAGSGPQDYGTVGIELVSNWQGSLNIGPGMMVQGFRIHVTADVDPSVNYYQGIGVSARNYGIGGSFTATYDSNRILLESRNKNMYFGGYGVPSRLTNNLIIQQGTLSISMLSTGGAVEVQGNTMVRRGGTPSATLMQGGQIYPRDNAFINCGGQLCDASSFAFSMSNVTDTAITSGAANGVTVAGNLVQNSTNDFRPAAGSALIGAGSQYEKYTKDLLAKNRGAAPDVGAFQLNPAPDLVSANITQEIVDGQSIIVSGTLDRAATSASGFLESQSYGVASTDVQAISLDNTGLTFTVTYDNVLPGTFIPNFTFVNDGGPAAAVGGVPVTLIGMTADAVDSGQAGSGTVTPTPTPTAPTVGITTLDTQVMMGGRATLNGTVNRQGDATGSVTLTIKPATGANLGPFVCNVSGNTWTIQKTGLAPGLYVFEVTASANGQTVKASTGSIRVLGLAQQKFNMLAS